MYKMLINVCPTTALTFLRPYIFRKIHCALYLRTVNSVLFIGEIHNLVYGKNLEAKRANKYDIVLR
jgi:hypothetical protein